MTQAQRRTWITSGQLAAGITLAILMYGAAASVFAQTVEQAATNATMAAQLTALSERVGKLESQNNYVLMAVFGSLITHLMQFRAASKGR